MLKPTLPVSLSHEDAVLPERQKEGDAGYDLTAVDVEYDEERNIYIYDTGVHIQLSKGEVGLIYPRSSVYKRGLILANSVGVIDSGYRGEIKVLFRPFPGGHNAYEVGDRVAQLVITPHSSPEIVQVKSLDESSRGSGGFGHTGS